MKNFYLKLLTPDRCLFQGEAVRLQIVLENGGIEILAGHIPMLGNVDIGKGHITLPDNSVKTFLTCDGILNVGKTEVLVLSDFLEWEENAEEFINLRQKHLEEELSRRKDSYLEYHLGRMALVKSFARAKKNDKIL